MIEIVSKATSEDAFCRSPKYPEEFPVALMVTVPPELGLLVVLPAAIVWEPK